MVEYCDTPRIEREEKQGIQSIPKKGDLDVYLTKKSGLNSGILLDFEGKVLYHAPGSKVPKRYRLYITFKDDSFLTATTQM